MQRVGQSEVVVIVKPRIYVSFSIELSVNNNAIRFSYKWKQEAEEFDA